MRTLTPYEHTHMMRYKPQLLRAVQEGEYGEMPIEYITGKVEFSGMVLHVDKRVLIPRVETEDLIDRAWLTICHHYSPTRKLRVVEVGTGSGAIGIGLWKRAVLHNLHQVSFHLLDISEEAIEVTKLNLSTIRQELQATFTGISEKRWPAISYQVSNLLEKWPLSKSVDLLVANLPYIPTARLPHLSESVRQFEPTLALDGGDDGLLYIQQLLKQAKEVMTPQGVCWLEIDDSHTAAAIVATDQIKPKWRCEDMVDGFGKMRFARCILVK